MGLPVLGVAKDDHCRLAGTDRLHPPTMKGRDVAGFFEKKIMQDIDGRLRAMWPGVQASIRQSDYHPDGLVIRVRAHQIAFFDLTTLRNRWTSVLGLGEEGAEGDPSSRRFADLGLSVGAPPAQVAPRWMEMLREDWNGVVTGMDEILRRAEAGEL
ncbi:hypothetical protein [Agromyces humi]|uniref:hypothetical protein n=1 Tax=Agromyces humi TaxID=1766800 RepID=UPI001358DC32|nr:hypothetical protein [Agromyces humi]